MWTDASSGCTQTCRRPQRGPRCQTLPDALPEARTHCAQPRRRLDTRPRDCLDTSSRDCLDTRLPDTGTAALSTSSTPRVLASTVSEAASLKRPLSPGVCPVTIPHDYPLSPVTIPSNTPPGTLRLRALAHAVGRAPLQRRARPRCCGRLDQHLSRREPFPGGETSLLRPETLDYWRARLGRSPLSSPLSSGERSASSRACGGEQARLRLVGRARAR